MVESEKMDFDEKKIYKELKKINGKEYEIREITYVDMEKFVNDETNEIAKRGFFRTKNDGNGIVKIEDRIYIDRERYEHIFRDKSVEEIQSILRNIIKKTITMVIEELRKMNIKNRQKIRYEIRNNLMSIVSTELGMKNINRVEWAVDMYDFRNRKKVFRSENYYSKYGCVYYHPYVGEDFENAVIFLQKEYEFIDLDRKKEYEVNIDVAKLLKFISRFIKIRFMSVGTDDISASFYFDKKPVFCRCREEANPSYVEIKKEKIKR